MITKKRFNSIVTEHIYISAYANVYAFGKWKWNTCLSCPIYSPLSSSVLFIFIFKWLCSCYIILRPTGP
uniref:Uncharacterized protein n=1 Tax=Anguilla anguilla TaxID=7936 RepID=A0A0E9XN19_ANGAN